MSHCAVFDLTNWKILNMKISKKIIIICRSGVKIVCLICIFLFSFENKAHKENKSWTVPSAGAVDYREGDRVPAQSSCGEVLFTGGGVVLPAPPHRELQSAVDGPPGGGLLHRQTQRWDLQREIKLYCDKTKHKRFHLRENSTLGFFYFVICC